MNSETLYREIFAGVPSAIYIVERNEAGKLIFADLNPAAEKKFQVERHRVVGLTLPEVMPLLGDVPFDYMRLGMSFESSERQPAVVIPLSSGGFGVCIS
ncbi:MAG: hypothetical protein LBS10_11535 [Gracilibacteraceae bacterium]|nr:hypothetical protein [Gracilibacteraceae bacterium]